MDARPQRPLRSMRPFTDENVALEGPLPKTIHHRNKSSPALTNTGSTIGLKAAAKRTAFGDVSNIIGGTRTHKDDSTIPTKSGIAVNVKLGHTVVENKSASFLRPAQRPLSVSSLRSLLTGSISIPPTTSQQGSLNNNNDVSLQPTATARKGLAKRATTIFKDAILDTVQEDEISEPQKASVTEQLPLPSATIHSQVTAPQSDSYLSLPAPVTSAEAQPEPVKEEQVVIVEPHPTNHTDAVHEIPAIYEDYVPSEPNSYLTNDSESSRDLIDQSHEPQEPLTVVEKPVTTTIKRQDPEFPTVLESSINAPEFQAHPSIMQLPSHHEPEEYWEEEDEDGYEEEGYVTARSFRSRGENTTGGATAILVPRMNQRAKREIDAATQLVEATRTPEEIEDESFDTSMVAEYGDEIFEYMRQLEVKMSPNPHYMDNQHEIQWSMRTVLMDWLVQVHHRFNLLPETLFLCVNYIDRFLSSKVVSLGKLQLVGATAIFIAAKYEEINCPSVQEIVYMVDGGYSMDEILKAERFMLTMLQFELGWPGPMSFLRRISKADDYDLETRTLAKYFLEVTLMDERFIGSPPSFTAAASHCLARLMLRKGDWSPHHVYYSGYTWTQLRSIVQLLVDCCEDPRKHHSAVYNKYCDKRYKRASIFVETELQRGFTLPESPLVKNIMQSSVYAYYSTNDSYFCV